MGGVSILFRWNPTADAVSRDAITNCCDTSYLERPASMTLEWSTDSVFSCDSLSLHAELMHNRRRATQRLQACDFGRSAGLVLPCTYVHFSSACYGQASTWLISRYLPSRRVPAAARRRVKIVAVQRCGGHAMLTPVPPARLRLKLRLPPTGPLRPRLENDTDQLQTLPAREVVLGVP